MTDPNPRPVHSSDPVHAAVKIANIESSIAHLSERFATGLAHLTQLMGISQDQQSRQATKLDEALRSLHAMGDYPAQMTRLSEDFSAWRIVHEKDNSCVADDLAEFKTTVSASLRTLRWVAVVVAAMGSVLITVTLYAYNLRMDAQRERSTSIEARVERLDGRGNTAKQAEQGP